MVTLPWIPFRAWRHSRRLTLQKIWFASKRSWCRNGEWLQMGHASLPRGHWAWPPAAESWSSVMQPQARTLRLIVKRALDLSPPLSSSCAPGTDDAMEAINLTLARWKQGQMLAFCKPTSCYSFDQLWLPVYPTVICMLVFCMFKFFESRLKTFLLANSIIPIVLAPHLLKQLHAMYVFLCVCVLLCFWFYW